jgi:hypothetical protein
MNQMDGSKYERELGQKYITLDKSVRRGFFRGDPQLTLAQVEDMYKSLKEYESTVWA